MFVADIGNTDTVFGIFDEKKLITTLRLRSNAVEGEVFYGYHLRNFFLENNIDKKLIEKGIFSSVVPNMTPVMEDVFCNITQDNYIKVVADLHPEIIVAIDNKDELGTDIYCNCVEAYLQFKSACIVIDFGTALTVTAVNDHGVVKGVAIAPGIGTALKSLFSSTAQLPEVPLELPKNAIGTNTISSIQSGVLFGYEGMVQNLIKKFQSELNVPCKIIATGGLSSVIHTLKPQFDMVDMDLTLKGLRSIGEKLL